MASSSLVVLSCVVILTSVVGMLNSCYWRGEPVVEIGLTLGGCLAPCLIVALLVVRWRRLSTYPRMVGMLALGTLIVSIRLSTTDPVPSLEVQGERLTTELSAYYERHGAFPEDLSAAGILLPEVCWGGFKYLPSPDSQHYVLRVGEYALDGFCIEWTDGVIYVDH